MIRAPCSPLPRPSRAAARTWDLSAARGGRAHAAVGCRSRLPCTAAPYCAPTGGHRAHAAILRCSCLPRGAALPCAHWGSPALRLRAGWGPPASCCVPAEGLPCPRRAAANTPGTSRPPPQPPLARRHAAVRRQGPPVRCRSHLPLACANLSDRPRREQVRKAREKG